MVVLLLYKFRFGVVVRLGIEQLMCFYRNTLQIYKKFLNYQGFLLFFYIILEKNLDNLKVILILQREGTYLGQESPVTLATTC